MAFLEISGVCKSFGGGRNKAEVLRDINFSMEQGEFVAIVGYSGVGKTTLMSLIAGLILPDAGSIVLKGKAVTGPGPERGLVFQNYSLLPWMTVKENVELGVVQAFPQMTSKSLQEHVSRYIELVNLSAARDKKPHELSGGMRQRVSVARALAMEPEILLLDEPFSALDALTRATLQDEIDRICQQEKRTVIMVTNDVDEGILLADRIIPLSLGPGATLGPEVPVSLKRPRDRMAVNHDPKFKRVRKEALAYLLEQGAAQRTSISRKLSLPDLLPEDLAANPKRWWDGRKARRGNVERRETVEVTL
jgi:nitrate/nitrite transport system ATP-binding protein